MASRGVLLLFAVTLLPFALARQNPADIANKDGLIDKPPININITVDPKVCIKLPANAEGTDEYQPSGLLPIFQCSPPPPGTTSPPPSSPPVQPPVPTPSGPAPTPISPVRAPSPAPTAP